MIDVQFPSISTPRAMAHQSLAHRTRLRVPAVCDMRAQAVRYHGTRKLHGRYVGLTLALLVALLLGARPAQAQTTISSNVTSGTALVYSDAVTIAADVTITAPSVTFESTVDGDGNGPWDLTLNVSGETRFEGKVGDTTPLANLTTDAAGTTTIAISDGGGPNSPRVETTGTQQYGDPVTLSFHQTLRAGESLIFGSTLDGGGYCYFEAVDRIEFNGAVGATTRPASIATRGSATVYVQTTEIRSGNLQNHRNTVVVDPAGASGTVTFESTSNAVIFEGALRSATDGEDNVVASARNVTFADIGDNSQRLAGLSTTTTVNPATVNGSLVVDGVSTFVNGLTLASGADLGIEIGGTTAGTEYDQVQVTGSVDITDADLVLTLDNDIPLSGPYTILDNDGTDAVTGTFAGLAEGATITVDGFDFTLSYVGGDGNDIVLTANMFDLLVDTISDSQTYDAITSLADCTDGVLDGDCTLREAIEVANANVGLDAIGFRITEAHGATPSGQATIALPTVLPPLTDAGISILGYTQPGASENTLATGSNAALKIVLEGTVISGFPNGIEVASSATGVTISGLSIVQFEGAGLHIEGAGAVVEGNYIGVRPNGTTATLNGYGVYAAATGIRIGTDGDSDGDAGERNVISGNDFYGVFLNAEGVTVAGNYIGLTADGTAALANAPQGLSVGSSAPNAVVTDNVISGNVSFGLTVMGDGANVHRNIIGLDATGQTAIPNGGGGVEIGNTIVGLSATEVVVQDNTISGNTGHGIAVDAASTASIIMNRIGLDTDGVDHVGNTDAGIEVTGTAEVSIRQNRIAGNGGLGIDLVGGTEDGFGVTANDDQDPDSGPNALQNYPVITGITPNGSGGYDIAFTLSAPSNTSYLFEVFASSTADPSGHGEGARFIGDQGLVPTLGTPDYTGTITVTDYMPGEFVTMTAAENYIRINEPQYYGPTSEFSAAFILADLAVNSTDDDDDATAGDEICDTGQTNAEGNPECTLRAAIQEANALAGADSIRFAIPASDAGCSGGTCVIAPTRALPDITSVVKIDGSTQPGKEAVCTTAIPDRPAYGIVLDGTNAGAGVSGLHLVAGSGGSVIRGLNIVRFTRRGVLVQGSSDNQIACSFIGIDATGSTAAGNTLAGVGIFPGSRNVIGTDGDGVNDAAEGNLISGNLAQGINLQRNFQNPNDNVVAGNYIGTDKSGTSAVANQSEGVQIAFTHRERVGTNSDGVSDAAERNVISGNGRNGIHIFRGQGHVVAGNYIGTDATGAAPLGNSQRGIRVWNGATGVRVGADGDGMNDAAEANVIAHNSLDGVVLGEAETQATILGNAIYSNGGLGIDLNVVNGNDADDVDEGPNRRQNYPDIDNATLEESGDVMVTYMVDTHPDNATYPLRIDFYRADATGQGQHWLGSDTYSEGDYNGTAVASKTQAGAFKTITFTPASVSPALTITDTIVATATDADGNTSEFSGTPTLLPVELVSFEAVGNGSNVELRWQTASETNNAGYDVQVRDEASGLRDEGSEASWSVLGFVEGVGTTAEPQNYTFAVAGLEVGTHVFRLRQVDFDGRFEYSPQVEVHIGVMGTHQLSAAYPNPFNPATTFSLAVGQAQAVRVAVYDVLGRQVALVWQGTLEADVSRAFVWEAGDYPSGLYFIRVTGERFAETRQVTLVK